MVLQRQYGAPEIVNDGATIAKDIELEDREENVGVRLIQEVRAPEAGICKRVMCANCAKCDYQVP